jgi:hypothetical protein
VTPYSMRRFTKLSDDEIACHISYITSDWKKPLISAARTVAEGSKEEENLISKTSQISQIYQTALSAEFSVVPQRGPSALIELSKVKDFGDLCEDEMKRKRGYTYEPSNIGVVQLPDDSPGNVRLEKLVFSQCAMVAGPAIGFTVISLKEGPFAITLSWQKRILENEFREGMGIYLNRRLLIL